MRPAVLIVDPLEERRRDVSRGLAERGYEAVPAVSADEGLRFAQGLGPSVIVAPAEMMGFGDAAILDRFAVRDRAMKRTLLLLGQRAGEGDVPEDVLFLPIEGLDGAELVRRIRLVLVGREIGVEADAELQSLVGELALTPLLELVRALHRCRLSGRLELEGGTILFDRGEVAAARAGETRGVKAFCRLSRGVEGPFHIRLGAVDQAREIELGVPELVLQAIEELQVELPDLRSKLRVVDGGAGGAERPSALEQNLLETIGRCDSVGELLDVLPATDGRVSQTLAVLEKRGWVRLEAPKVGVAVITDSTADLPPDLARRHGISIVPLSILFGNDTFRDGVDLQPRDFYRLLESSPEHPSTRPPPEAEFFESFLARVAEQDVVSVHISEKMSQTVVHARQAALRGGRTFQQLPIGRSELALEVVDTSSVSMGVGLLALFAARMALRGEGAATIARRLHAMVPRVHVLFAVDTLDFLARGGRIGKAQALAGKLLGIKPILGVVNGEVAPVDRVRGGRRVHPRIAELVGERVDPAQPLVAAVAHANAPVWGDRLGSLLESRFDVRELVRTDIGPVVGTHAGPGCVGCVVFQPTAEEWPLVASLD